MFAKSITTIVLRPKTITTPYLRISRDIHSFDFTNKNILSTKPEERKRQAQLVIDFCDRVGIDNLKAKRAEASGPAHTNINDKDEPWERITCEIIDEHGNTMIFEGGGKIWDRVHVATNKAYWYQPGFFKLIGLRPNPNRPN